MTNTSASRRRLLGGCACGGVRYEVTGTPFHRTLCHCSICRRISGAPMVGWFTVLPIEFRFLQGEAKCYRSSPVATRSFCGACGTPLTYRHDGLDEIDVTICSLDEAATVMPQDHTFAGSMLQWMETAHLLSRHSTVRDADS